MEDITLISLVSLIFGFIILLCKMIYKSKCSDCEICFGMFKIKRNIDKEIEKEKYNIDHNINSNDDLENLKNVIK